MRASAVVWALAGVAAWAGPGELSDADVAAAIEAVRARYPDAGQVSDEAMRRFQLEGLMAGLDPKVEWAEEDAGAGVPWLDGTLPGRIAYVRPGKLDAAVLDAALAGWGAQGAAGFIVDLRGAERGASADAAVEFARRFTEKGTVLFEMAGREGVPPKIATATRDRAARGPVAVVVSRGTAGGAELLAAVLREHAGALLIGEKTAGQAAEMAEIALPSGVRLRVPLGVAKFGERAAVPGGGLVPDIAVEGSEEEIARWMRTAEKMGLLSVVEEKERARINEAALMAGENPELDWFRAKPEKEERAVTDRMLQRALDALTAIGVLRGG